MVSSVVRVSGQTAQSQAGTTLGPLHGTRPVVLSLRPKTEPLDGLNEALWRETDRRDLLNLALWRETGCRDGLNLALWRETDRRDGLNLGLWGSRWTDLSSLERN